MGGKRHWSVRFFPQENKFENETSAGHQGAWRKQKGFSSSQGFETEPTLGCSAFSYNRPLLDSENFARPEW
jgi:hypothetical protein